MAKRRVGTLALLTLFGGFAIAALVGQQAVPIATEPAPAININQYLNLMAHRCNNLNALAQLLEDAQSTYLPILPPDPDFILTMHGALTPFNFNSLPEGFNIQLLIPGEAHGVAAVTLTLAQDPTTRETVFMNSVGDVLYKLPPAPGYDPYAWLRARWPGLFQTNFPGANTNQWLKNHDPARIQLSLRLISIDDVVPYLQALALAQSSNAAAQQGSMAPMTMMSSDPCSITNESDPFAVLSIQPDGSGGMTITWESCTGRVYAVEARADLLDTAGWVALASNAGVVGSTSWTDTEALLYPTRFYRVQRQPYNFCSASNCVLTNLVSGIPDWWLIENGYPVTTPFDTIAPNGLPLQKCYQDGTLPTTPVATPTDATVTGQIHRVVLGKCGFDEFTVNPTNVYLQSDIVGELENCGGLTSQYLIVSFNPTNGLPSTNGDMLTDFAITGSFTNSPLQLVFTNSNPDSPEILTNTLSRLYETTLLTNLALNAFLANTNMTAVTNSAQCAAIRALTPDEKTNTLQRLDYWITFSSQAGVDYNVQWVEHTDFANGTSTNIFLTELVPGNGSTASTSNYPLALPSSYGTSTVMMASVALIELSFTNNYTIKSDNGATDYTDPQWQDPNGDGDVSDGHSYPLCFTRNTKMKLTTGKWHVNLANPPFTIKIKGDGPGDLDFPETTATVSGNDVTISNLECSAAFSNAIDYYNPLAVDWKASIDGGATWFSAGKSTNQTYVTLSTPASSTNIPLYYTLLHVGCKNAHGETTITGAVEAIWSDFEDRIVKRADGQTLYYYSNSVPTNTAADLSGLLTTGDGQCTAWADFFYGILLAQGITDSGIQVISPHNVYLCDSNDIENAQVTNAVVALYFGGFLVKHWTLSNANWATNDTNHNGIPDDVEAEYPDVIEIAQTGSTRINVDFLLPYCDYLLTNAVQGTNDIKITGTGLKGQGDIVPSVQKFMQHYIVTRGEPYAFPPQSYIIYDPSYGKKYEGIHAVNQWASNALDGFFQQETLMGGKFEVIPNDTNCPITVDLCEPDNYIIASPPE